MLAAEAIGRQQAELAKQAEILLKVVEASGQVTRLEDALNRNLASLGRAEFRANARCPRSRRADCSPPGSRAADDLQAVVLG